MGKSGTGLGLVVMWATVKDHTGGFLRRRVKIPNPAVDFK